jgi:hypothetical protein
MIVYRVNTGEESSEAEDEAAIILHVRLLRRSVRETTFSLADVANNALAADAIRAAYTRGRFI